MELPSFWNSIGMQLLKRWFSNKIMICHIKNALKSLNQYHEDFYKKKFLYFSFARRTHENCLSANDKRVYIHLQYHKMKLYIHMYDSSFFLHFLFGNEHASGTQNGNFSFQAFHVWNIHTRMKEKYEKSVDYVIWDSLRQVLNVETFMRDLTCSACQPSTS